MEKILFSGIGDTDPFRGNYDGSMLHIVRHCKPKKVYLYFTKEMYLSPNKVENCKASIKAIDKNIEIIILPNDQNLIVDAHHQEVYINPFKEIINNIIKENKNCEILLNIASGTPSMKNTMLLLSLFDNDIFNNKGNLKAIQVSSPNKGSNITEKKIIDVKDVPNIVTEELYDNLDEAPTRIMPNQYETLKANFIANQIITMIEKYQYVGAYLLIEKNKHLFSNDVYLLISHLKHRSTFDIKKADELLKELNLDNFIIHNQSLKRLVEYFNVIKINEDNLSYHDTLIMISALIELLFEKIIEKLLNIDFQKVLEKKRVNISKVEKFYPQIKQVFENTNSNYNYTTLKYYHLTTLLNNNYKLLSKPHKDLMKIFNTIKDTRNDLAHEVDIYVFNQINPSSIKKALRIINANIKDLYKDEYKKEHENIYNNLNKILIRKLWH